MVCGLTVTDKDNPRRCDELNTLGSASTFVGDKLTINVGWCRQRKKGLIYFF